MTNSTIKINMKYMNKTDLKSRPYLNIILPPTLNKIRPYTLKYPQLHPILMPNNKKSAWFTLKCNKFREHGNILHGLFKMLKRAYIQEDQIISLNLSSEEELDIPNALRKRVRNSMKHAINNFTSNGRLSPKL